MVPIQPTPKISLELYREIAENLDHFKDRSTLLSLALVDRTWRDESQRQMYRNVADVDEKGHSHVRSFKTHTLFLQSILASAVLGSYVRAYCQSDIAVDPDGKALLIQLYMRTHSQAYQALDETEDPLDFVLEIDLWHLTHRALPLMPNLKHLFFVSAGALDGGRLGPIASQSLLTHSKFTLQTLSWEFGNDDDVQQNFIPFLRTQTALYHLEVSDYETTPEYRDLSWLPADVCPNLVSASCPIYCMEQIMRDRDIKAFRMFTFTGLGLVDVLPRASVAAVKHLAYLSVTDYESFRRFVGPVDLNIRVLELLVWDHRVCFVLHWCTFRLLI